MTNKNASSRSRFIRLALVAAALATVPFLYARLNAAVRPSSAQQQSPGGLAWAPQTLSPAGQSSLAALAASGNDAALRWPNFSDYTAHVQKFYGLYGNALPWVRDMKATPQAQQMIALFENAELKGLTPEDYDAPRWADRLAKLKPAAQNASEADAIAFDVAMTVCTMRYISDLHIGKVNPKHFDYGFNVAAKKYDLPEFLKEHVVDVQDETAALATIEPPYPGYKRTIAALGNYLAMAKADDGEQLPAVTKPVVPGDTWAGVPRLAQVLKLYGDLPASADTAALTSGNVYQGALVNAVKSFQARY